MYWERDRDYKRTITSLESARARLTALIGSDAEKAGTARELDSAREMIVSALRSVKDAKNRERK